MTHFLIRLATPLPGAAEDCPASLDSFMVRFALGAILLPWLLAPAVDDVSNALEFGKLIDGLWPVAPRLGLALVLWRLGWPFPTRRPATASSLRRPFHRLQKIGPWLEIFDAHFRQWSAAGVSFLVIMLALLTAAIAGH